MVRLGNSHIMQTLILSGMALNIRSFLRLRWFRWADPLEILNSNKRLNRIPISRLQSESAAVYIRKNEIGGFSQTAVICNQGTHSHYWGLSWYYKYLCGAQILVYIHILARGTRQESLSGVGQILMRLNLHMITSTKRMPTIGKRKDYVLHVSTRTIIWRPQSPLSLKLKKAWIREGICMCHGGVGHVPYPVPN